jgi:hypothetical protein
MTTKLQLLLECPASGPLEAFPRAYGRNRPDGAVTPGAGMLKVLRRKRGLAPVTFLQWVPRFGLPPPGLWRQRDVLRRSSERERA